MLLLTRYVLHTASQGHTQTDTQPAKDTHKHTQPAKDIPRFTSFHSHLNCLSIVGQTRAKKCLSEMTHVLGGGPPPYLDDHKLNQLKPSLHSITFRDGSTER